MMRGQQVFLLHQVADIKVHITCQTPAFPLTLTASITVATCVRDKRTADVGIGASIGQSVMDVDIDVLAFVVEQTQEFAVVILIVVNKLESDFLVEETLRDSDVIGIPLLIFPFIRTIHKIVIEVKDGGDPISADFCRYLHLRWANPSRVATSGSKPMARNCAGATPAMFTMLPFSSRCGAYALTRSGSAK